jgi:alanyl-tRNA synthetase
MTQQTRLYYTDSKLLQHRAKVVAIESNAVKLDATIFHPQGGGQPSDIGTIDGIAVIKVQENHEGEIWHTLEKTPEFVIGEEVDLHIDGLSRNLFSRLHSAGHLIAHVTEHKFPELKAIQGHHFPSEARVEFSYTNIPDMTTFKDKLTSALQEIISSDVKVKSIFDDTIRKIIFANYPATPCGGTHVQSLSEIGTIAIRNIKNKDGKLRVGYNVA